MEILDKKKIKIDLLEYLGDDRFFEQNHKYFELTEEEANELDEFLSKKLRYGKEILIRKLEKYLI